MRRTDSFDLQSETLQAVFEKVLDGDNEGAVALTRKAIDDLVAGNVDPSKLVISRTVRDFDSYKASDRMVNVRAAKKLQEMGYEFQPGMKVSWVVTDGRKSPNEVEPWVEGREFKARPDYRYYATRLSATISRVTDSFGWDQKSLVSGAQQVTFKDNDFESKRAAKVAAQPKRTDKKLKLDDFM